MNFSILAMQSLVKNCLFSWSDPYIYENIIWLDPRPIPTKKEWETERNKIIDYQPKQNCKNQAKSLIASSDWSVLPDVNIANKSEFESYRSVLRNYILNPVENPVFPTEPAPIWAVSQQIGDNNG